MAQLFADGFESGDFSAWTSTSNTPSVITTSPYNGTYCAEMRTTSIITERACRWDPGTNPAQAYFRVYWRPTDALEDYVWHNVVTMVGGAWTIIRADAEGNLMLITNEQLRGTTTGAVSVGTWDMVQYRVYWAGASSVCELKFGAETITDTTSLTTASIDFWELIGGSGSSTTPQGMRYDAAVVDDADYPGALSTGANPLTLNNTGMRPAFFKPGLSR